MILDASKRRDEDAPDGAIDRNYYLVVLTLFERILRPGLNRNSTPIRYFIRQTVLNALMRYSVLYKHKYMQ